MAAGRSPDLSDGEKGVLQLQFGSQAFKEQQELDAAVIELDKTARDPWPWVEEWFVYRGMSQIVPNVKRNRKAFYQCKVCGKKITAFASTAQALKKHHTKVHRRSDASWEKAKGLNKKTAGATPRLEGLLVKVEDDGKATLCAHAFYFAYFPRALCDCQNSHSRCSQHPTCACFKIRTRAALSIPLVPVCCGFKWFSKSPVCNHLLYHQPPQLAGGEGQ